MVIAVVFLYFSVNCGGAKAGVFLYDSCKGLHFLFTSFLTSYDLFPFIPLKKKY